ncbi:MAG: hypothetical protein ACXV3U_00070 [Halobacteriota archaeon]
MGGEENNEGAQAVVTRLKKQVEAQCGPIFISRVRLKELAELYRMYKKEYGQVFAAEEIQNRIKVELH